MRKIQVLEYSEVRSGRCCYATSDSWPSGGVVSEFKSAAQPDLLEAVFFVMIFAVSAHNAVQK